MANSGANVRSKCVLFLSVLAVIPFVKSQRRSEIREEDCKCENLKVASSRIVNGTTSGALRRGLPWISFLYIRTYLFNALGFKEFSNEQLMCTSIVIARWWVLTGKSGGSYLPSICNCFQMIF